MRHRTDKAPAAFAGGMWNLRCHCMCSHTAGCTIRCGGTVQLAAADMVSWRQSMEKEWEGQQSKVLLVRNMAFLEPKSIGMAEAAVGDVVLSVVVAGRKQKQHKLAGVVDIANMLVAVAICSSLPQPLMQLVAER